MTLSQDNFKRFALASLVLVGLMFVLPFLHPHHYFPMPTFRSEWLAFALGLVALAPLAAKRAWQDGQLPAVALAPLGLAAIVLLQAALGRVPYVAQAFTATLYLVWAALLIALGAMLRRELGMSRIVSVLAWCLVIGGELNAVVAMAQYYDVLTVFDPLIMPNAGGVYGNLGQRNHFATYMALAIASALYLYASYRVHGVAAAIVMMPLIFALGLCLSRSAWLYLAAMLILAYLLKWSNAHAHGRRVFFGIVFTVCVFAIDQGLMTQRWFAPSASVDGYSATIRLMDEPGLDIKWQHLRTAWWTFLQAPLLGAGWGQFPWHDFEFKVLYGNKYAFGAVSHTHNLITHLLVETGLIGALLIIVGILVWIRDLQKNKVDLELWWLLALLATMGIHSMLEYPLWHAYFLGVAAFTLGLGASRFILIPLQRIGAPAVMLLLAVGLFNVSTLWYAYRDFERMFVLRPKALPGDELAAIIERGQDDPVLQPYVELAASAYILVNRDQLQDKLALNARVMRFMPADIVVYRQALLLALDGQAESARKLFVSAMRVYPDTLPRITNMLHELTARDPVEFRPLLELAVAKRSAIGAQ